MSYRAYQIPRAMTALGTMLLIGLPLLMMLGGCAFARGTMGGPFGEQKVSTVRSIQKGVTTRAEVTDQLGAPQKIVSAGGREIHHYQRHDATLGLFLIFSRINILSDNLYVLYDGDGIVEEVIFGKRTDDLEFQVWPFGD